ncbi:hypothetical protein [Pseudoalteromonas sp. CnMc7-37]|uniref:hypothetical protein n=1 Tax=Pseudoalteromonas sp. CnMc7-37 TaxID=2954496 RepID=UPI0020979EDA|nr:hypothetical protein [Pseudoalteromonas sp. CnMc7-37]MCO7205817.1 hypothetical protein [Pseudoalteromonas sp. CnMc7-37]
MKTLKLSEHSFSSLKQLCRSVITHSQLNVKMLPQCLDTDMISKDTLFDKMQSVITLNQIDSILVPYNSVSRVLTSPLYGILKDLNLTILYEEKTEDGNTYITTLDHHIPEGLNEIAIAGRIYQVRHGFNNRWVK